MELVRFPSHGGLSVRSIFSFVIAVIVTAILWATLTGTPAGAQATNATWTDGDAILYDGHAFNKTENVRDTSNTIPDGASVYQSAVQSGGTGASPKVFIIYFSSGVDPPTATSARYVEFTQSGGSLSRPTNGRDITLTPQGQDDSLAGEVNSSCSVGGIGWIVCPVSVFLAESMDGIFNILAGMIETQPPILGDENNSLYTAWNVSRTIANIAFVIAFLIIIYSQLTNIGISNYGLKRLIPRLIVAAVLVNVSFFISALAIDISNILGYSVQDIFNGIREQLFQLNNDNFAGVNNNGWAAVTSVVLAGGGAIGGIYYLYSAGPFFLVALLVSLALLLLFVLVILAARQAIIVILVILSPLAFVAYLLPNTEKWFDKWKDLFMTMLIFFPAFSLVFGGSQLAGQLIIQNAGGNLITVIFGMAVQVAPLVITPIILKFSGGLLGRIAQIANNPRKGVLDRTKNWQREREDLHRSKNLQRNVTKNPLTWGAGAVQAVDGRRRRRKELTDMYKLRADNKWHEGNAHKKISERMADAEMAKDRIHSEHAAHIDHLKAGHGKPMTRGLDLHAQMVRTEGAKTVAEQSGAEVAATIAAYRAGVYTTTNPYLSEAQEKMAKNVISTAAWKQAESANQYVQQRNLATAMRSDDSLLDIAKGYGPEEIQVIARERAQANAVATLTKLNRDARENAITLMETEAVEAGDSVKDYAIKKVFANANSADSTVSPSRLEAALEIAASDGQVTVFDQARSSEFIDQALVDAVVARHVGDMKSKGGFHIQANPQLSLQRYIEAFNNGDTSKGSSLDEVRATFMKDINKARLETLSNTNAANLGGMKYGAFVGLAADILGDPSKNKPSILNVIETDANGAPTSADDLATLRKIYESLTDGLSDPSTRAGMTDRLAEARLMQEKLRAQFFKEEEPLKLSQTERAMPNATPNLPESMGDNPDIPTPSTDRTDSTPSEDQQE